ncbi:MAG TPA: anhydro-N-acetylmuramic acid kinase [Bacteroidota bacterium]
MNKLSRLQHKNTRLVAGLMSGTSVDGIDAALVRIAGSGTSTLLKLLAFETYPFPKGFREFVLKNSLPGAGSVDLIARLNILYAHFFADAVKAIARKAHVPLTKIDLIGSHGQTVHHLPQPHRMFGKTVRASLQIGDPSTIAQLTGITTVGDFRTADMAAGGQGAPLAPYFDFIVCRSKTKNRILLNLGGIANFTVLPKNCSERDVVAFDTGPANMVIDALMMKFYGKQYDAGGAVALRGTVLSSLLAWMMTHPFFKRRPPKSTGREEFGAQFMNKLLKRAKGMNKSDIVATATEFTAYSVYDQCRRFVSRHMKVDELLVSGGGVYNKAIMKRLRQLFAPARVTPIEEIGVSSDAKEAMIFALLANETIAENPSNIPSVTGARKPAVLGKICLP